MRYHWLTLEIPPSMDRSLPQKTSWDFSLRDLRFCRSDVGEFFPMEDYRACHSVPHAVSGDGHFGGVLAFRRLFIRVFGQSAKAITEVFISIAGEYCRILDCMVCADRLDRYARRFQVALC